MHSAMSWWGINTLFLCLQKLYSKSSYKCVCPCTCTCVYDCVVRAHVHMCMTLCVCGGGLSGVQCRIWISDFFLNLLYFAIVSSKHKIHVHSVNKRLALQISISILASFRNNCKRLNFGVNIGLYSNIGYIQSNLVIIEQL